MAERARKPKPEEADKVVEFDRNKHGVGPEYHEAHDDLMSGHTSKKVEEGEGPWLVSYADMMTLLMGFFALIASFSKPDAKEFDKVAAAASEYFGGKHEAPYERLGDSIMRALKENNIQDQVKVDVGVTGVTMTFTGTLFFDSGSFLVKEQAIALMNTLSGVIKKDAPDYLALVEGHTDSAPIHHPIIASNWELSGIRAARIAQIFETNGFNKKQLTIMGWGETKPIANDNNPDGTPHLENRTKNRRVVIRVYRELPSDKTKDPNAKAPAPGPHGAAVAKAQPSAPEAAPNSETPPTPSPENTPPPVEATAPPPQAAQTPPPSPQGI